jgi:hypothetical protein
MLSRTIVVIPFHKRIVFVRFFNCPEFSGRPSKISQAHKTPAPQELPKNPARPGGHWRARRPDPGGRPGYLRVDTLHQGDTEHARGVYTGRTSEGEAKQVAKGRIKLTQDSSSFEPPCEQATCHLFSASYEHSAHPIHLAARGASLDT